MIEKKVKIEEECELRMQVKGKSISEITLLNGNAEILGSQLELDKNYSFSPSVDITVPVFTWHGCSLKLASTDEIQDISLINETPMAMYLNAHACLEKLRLSAEKGGLAPITMVVGDKDAGKSSLCKILVNYAVREGRTPVFVDIDVGQGEISIPGTLGAVVVDGEIPVLEGYSEAAPVIFSFGSIDPKFNLPYFKKLITRLGDTVHEKLVADKKVASSGVIINTCGWINGDGYKILMHVAQAFEVDIIITLEDEKLYNNLVKDIPIVKIYYLPKSDGIKDSGKQLRHDGRDNRLRNYFYGSHRQLETYNFDVNFNELKIFEVLSSDSHSSGSSDHDSCKVVPVELCSKLRKSIVAVSLATESEDLIASPVVGFICLLHVNMEEKTVTVLSPQPKPLPKTFLLLTHQTLPRSH